MVGQRTVDQQEIVDSIEDSIFTFPDIPGVTTVVAVPWVAVMHGLLPSPEANAVGKARLTEENVDATIDQVKEIFREANKVCGW